MTKERILKDLNDQLNSYSFMKNSGVRHPEFYDGAIQAIEKSIEIFHRLPTEKMTDKSVVLSVLEEFERDQRLMKDVNDYNNGYWECCLDLTRAVMAIEIK